MSEAKEQKFEFTKFERARVIGARALQISMGAPFILDFKEKDLEEMKYDPIRIAIKEFGEGVVPMSIKRPEPGSLFRSKLLTHKKGVVENKS